MVVLYMKINRFNLSKLATPCYLIDYSVLEHDLQLAQLRAEKLNIKLLLSVKGFPLAAIYKDISKYLSGISAASLFEAKIGKYMNEEVHIHSPVYKGNQFQEILNNADYIVFNSYSQLHQFKDKILENAGQKSFGIRFNPEFSEIAVDKYNPCQKCSRFGVRMCDFDKIDINIIDGIHIHAMNENSAETFRKLIYTVIEKIGDNLYKLKWINLGGGQLITDDEFDIEKLIEPISILTNKYNLNVYIEPCESLVTKSGYLVASVIDVINNEKNIAILDTSAVCHMPDVLSMPYRPDIKHPVTSQNTSFSYVLAGNSCLEGDIIGEYGFNAPLQIGDKIIFSDMGAYTFSQENYFNGINYPDIILYRDTGGCKTLKHFDYKEYEKLYY